MERARVHGLVSEAKFIPRGIAGNGYDRGVNCAVIKITYIFYSVGLLIKECLEIQHSRSTQCEEECHLMNKIFHQTHSENVKLGDSFT